MNSPEQYARIQPVSKDREGYVSPERLAYEDMLDVINLFRTRTSRFGAGKDFADFVLDEVGNRLDLYEFRHTPTPLLAFVHPDRRLSIANFIEVVVPYSIHLVHCNDDSDVGTNIWFNGTEPTMFLERFGTGASRELWVMTPDRPVPPQVLERFKQGLAA